MLDLLINNFTLNYGNSEYMDRQSYEKRRNSKC